jgi:hypothetical protein
MAASPYRSQATARTWLYRTLRGRVISGVVSLGLLAQITLPATVSAQTGRAAKPNQGPRALGLLVLQPNGKAHLIPITILIDGKYYDASAYKAAPVPMALWSETVYEAMRTGVSQGLFTVTGALQKKDARDGTEWMGEGTWQTTDALKAKAAKKPAASPVPRGMNEDEGPPVLRRAGGGNPKPTDTPAVPATPPQTQSTPASAPSATPAVGQPATGSTASDSSLPAVPSHPDQAQQDTPPEDPDRPVLKRGMPPAPKSTPEPLKAPGHPGAPPAAVAAKSATTNSAPASQVQLIPAISDSHGPDLQPYSFDMKPDEEQQFRKKMLAIAADEVRARAGLASARTGASGPVHASSQRSKAPAAKAVQPVFDDVQLRVFDLSNSNEPEFVLTANARMPQRSSKTDSATSDLPYMITLVAREDVNGEFHKALVNITDTQHLDIQPRLELIDAVDADGDGRGELLFRQVADAGSAFVVYRVIGDRLYPLFQGTPGK